MSALTDLDRGRLSTLLAAERATYAASNPRSRAASRDAAHLFGRVPMTWMAKQAGGFRCTSQVHPAGASAMDGQGDVPPGEPPSAAST